MVILKKNGKLKICAVLGNSMQQQRRTLTHCLSQMKSSTTIVAHESYTFLDGFSRYHHISIAPKDQQKITFATY